MSFRLEEKLYIKPEHLLDFREYLSKNLSQKLHHPRKIKSLYFDNINFNMYSDSVEGLVPRKKIRIRNYPNEKDKEFYFEIKNSSVEGRFKKRNIIKKYEFENFKNRGYFDNQYGSCFPNIYVEYDREYLMVDDIRISIDTNLLYTDFRTQVEKQDSKIIIELKTSIKKNLDNLIKLFPFERIRFSKYCFAVESLNYFN
jgi:SPX domain protein involved in polyphosphate accumulation